MGVTVLRSSRRRAHVRSLLWRRLVLEDGGWCVVIVSVVARETVSISVVDVRISGIVVVVVVIVLALSSRSRQWMCRLHDLCGGGGLLDGVLWFCGRRRRRPGARA